MARCRTLSIRNWERFQHYKDRRPPWVKFYVELLDDYELSRAPVATRLLANLLLLVAAKTNNRIPNDAKWLASQVLMDENDVLEGVANLVDMRYLVLARRKQSAKPETETERDKDKQASKPASRSPYEMPETALLRRVV